MDHLSAAHVVFPQLPRFNQLVQDRDELAHAGDNRDLGLFAR